MGSGAGALTGQCAWRVRLRSQHDCSNKRDLALSGLALNSLQGTKNWNFIVYKDSGAISAEPRGEPGDRLLESKMGVP